MRQTDGSKRRSGKPRARWGHVAPYAWLGAGAIVLGVGAAMVGGTAVAYADDGPSDGGAKNTSDSSGGTSQDSGTHDSPTNTKNVTSHSARSAKVSGSGRNTRAQKSLAAVESATQAPPATAAARTATETAADAPGAGETAGDAPGAGETARTVSTSAAHSARVRATVDTTTPPKASSSDPTSTAAALPAADPTSTAAHLPTADPAPNTNSYLPTDPIVAGVAYTLGRQQLAEAQTALNTLTWGTGNIAGGLAAIVPQLFLSSAAATLDFWSATNAGAQGVFAGTANIPIVHQLAGGNLLVNMLLPALAGAQMNGAALLLPLVGLFTGSGSVDPISNRLSAATSNTRVYGIVPVSMQATTQPVVYVAVNGGRSVPVLVDTGSSGLVMDYYAVPQAGLGRPTGTGSASYSGLPTDSFRYTDYTTKIDFGNGIVTDPTTVHLVDQADSAAFQDLLSWGAQGILGIGANAGGFAPNVPTASLPGELKDGVLLYQGLFLGFAGLMIFGQNPMPVRASLPGAPAAYLQVQVGDGAKTTVGSVIDSGGVYGTLLQSIVGGSVGSKVPAGTTISVYTADGNTLLYSFTTTSSGSPTVISKGLMNTGYFAFQQGPVYLNYTAPDRIGSTDFNYA